MFTGLIEEIGEINGIEKAADGMIFSIRAAKVLEKTLRGDSIAVNGACLTVTDISREGFAVFASRVTCEATTLGGFARGKRVHLERALTLSSRLGGHIVQGHVDSTGQVIIRKKSQNGLEMVVSVPGETLRYMVSKGSVAVDGVSLTVVALGESGFTLYLIPETLRGTMLGDLSIGDMVNVETDILAKYVERMMGRGADSGTDKDASLVKKLMEEGYM